MQTIPRPSLRKGKSSIAMLAAALAGLLASAPASAQWATIDMPHIKAQMAEFAQEAARWGEQGRQWVKEYQQWKAQYDAWLSSIESMQTSFGMQQGATMQEVSDNFHVEEECGEQGGGNLLGSIVGVDARGNLYAQNYRYCASAQIMRNRRYNEVVRYLRDTVPSMQSELDAAGQQFVGSGKTQGDMTAYSAKMNKVESDIDTAHKRFEAQMLGYDAYIRTQETNQATLAKTAMRGGSGLKSQIKQMADAAAVFTALCGRGQCETED
jgi:hypothetical protein